MEPIEGPEVNTHFPDPKAEHLWEHAQIGLAFVSANGMWLRVNPFLSELLGYTPGELMKRTFQSVTHPDDVLEDEEMVAMVLKGDLPGYTMTKRYLPKVGSPIWIRLYVTRLVDPKSGEFGCFLSQIRPVSHEELDVYKGNLPTEKPATKGMTVDDVSEFLNKHWKKIAWIGGAIGTAMATYFGAKGAGG